MTPNNFLLTKPRTIAVFLSKLQRALYQERNENTMSRSGCWPDCQEHA
jgi:hypothetical protein